MIENYLSLTKPGIIFGNIITALAGFFLASQGPIDIGLLCAMLIGLSLIVASGCILNNIYDRDIDALMERTHKRPLAQGTISVRHAMIFAVLLGVIGMETLLLFTNIWTFAAAIVGFGVYTIVYTTWAKRRTPYATLIGSISGAMPPVIGYSAVPGGIDIVALILFAILVAWQMPHFFAIALYRREDYACAQIPTWPIVYGEYSTKRQMFFYITGFIIATFALTTATLVSQIYLYTMMAIGLLWLTLEIRGFWAPDTYQWARRMFLFSLLTIIIFTASLY